MKFKYYKRKEVRTMRRVGMVVDILPAKPILINAVIFLWKWHLSFGVMFNENDVSERKDT